MYKLAMLERKCLKKHPTRTLRVKKTSHIFASLVYIVCALKRYGPHEIIFIECQKFMQPSIGDITKRLETTRILPLNDRAKIHLHG